MECTNVAHWSKPKENGSLPNSDNINKTVVTTSTGQRLPLGAALIVETPWGSVLSPELEGGFSTNFQTLLVIGSWNTWLGTARNKLEALIAFLIKWWLTPQGSKARWSNECELCLLPRARGPLPYHWGIFFMGPGLWLDPVSNSNRQRWLCDRCGSQALRAGEV